MKRHHDIGGDTAGPVNPSDHPVEPWAKMLTATLGALRSRGYSTVDELRRHIEDLPPEVYDQPYFERWAEAITDLLDEKGMVSRAEIEARVEALRAKLQAAQ